MTLGMHPSIPPQKMKSKAEIPLLQREEKPENHLHLGNFDNTFPTSHFSKLQLLYLPAKHKQLGSHQSKAKL